MKIVMTLLVRNEADIIEANIEYHLSRGVDFFIITDNLSTDDTPSILNNYQNRGLAHIIHEPADDYSQHVWVTRMARMAAQFYKADWVINNDADEFWWPHTGNLKEFFASVSPDVFAIRVDRSNFPVALITNENQPFFETMLMRDTQSVNAQGVKLSHKTCHRADPWIQVAQGNHTVSREGSTGQVITSSEIEILHFPVRSYAQFEKKIRLGGAAYERNTTLSKKIGSTWRHLYELWKAGELHAEYVKHAPCYETDNDQTRYCTDTRLRNALRALLLQS